MASKSTAPVDVIVHGTADEIDALAARHGLTIRKRLDDGAVFRANAAQLDALSSESLSYLSRDVEVTSFMAVTDPAIGADQVWAGVAGLPGFTGSGIGIAIIDSGVWAQHSALSGRVVFEKISSATATALPTSTATARTWRASSPATARIRRTRCTRRRSAAWRPAPT